ncbi:hypothetical protein Acr_09g0003900 [Actinidia rufa]|uniref:Uncharacterized protein n=1 Tax=Actinidia rufa TaxID=165716 RepID=A0A7J0F5H0_9ERIC|nr:hypothetical protein Acr_09g0003900 [Actinidia rufa]
MRFLTPSVIEKVICAISLTTELLRHRAKMSSWRVIDSHDQARAKRTHPEVPDAILPETSREWTRQKNLCHQGSHYTTRSWTLDPTSVMKGKTESLHNYNKHYWETYNEIEEYSKALAVVSYKVGLTPGERIWKDLSLSPSVDLLDLMFWVEMFARLEDDVWQAEQNAGSAPRCEGNSKDGRTTRLIMRTGQGGGSVWFSRNQSTSSLLEFKISHTSRSPNPWEGTLKGAINGGCVPTTRRRHTELRIAELSRPSLTRVGTLKSLWIKKRPEWRKSRGHTKPQTKVALRLLIEGRKASEELPNVLEANRTTPRKVTNETPYPLAFRFEATILLEEELAELYASFELCSAAPGWQLPPPNFGDGWRLSTTQQQVSYRHLLAELSGVEGRLPQLDVFARGRKEDRARPFCLLLDFLEGPLPRVELELAVALANGRSYYGKQIGGWHRLLLAQGPESHHVSLTQAHIGIVGLPEGMSYLNFSCELEQSGDKIYNDPAHVN